MAKVSRARAVLRQRLIMKRRWLKTCEPRKRFFPPEAKQFLLAGGLPSIVQALCTAIAVGAGILAYNSWKNQEAAKRKAEIAASILQNVYAASRCVETGMPFFTTPLPSPEKIEAFAASGIEAMERCSPEFEKVAVDVWWSRSTLDEATTEKLQDYAIWLRNRASRYRELRRFASLSEERLRDIQVRGVVARMMNELGHRRPPAIVSLILGRMNYSILGQPEIGGLGEFSTSTSPVDKYVRELEALLG